MSSFDNEGSVIEPKIEYKFPPPFTPIKTTYETNSFDSYDWCGVKTETTSVNTTSNLTTSLESLDNTYQVTDDNYFQTNDTYDSRDETSNSLATNDYPSNIALESSYHIKRHTLKRHCVKLSEFTCQTCKRKFTNRKALKWHSKLHFKKRAHECDVCGKTYRWPSDLYDHKATHTTRQKRYMCEVCGKAFYKRSTLWVHKAAHTGRKNGKSDGESTSTLYGQLDDLNGGVLVKNEGGGIALGCHVVCRICGKGFEGLKSLSAHVTRDHST